MSEEKKDMQHLELANAARLAHLNNDPGLAEERPLLGV